MVRLDDFKKIRLITAKVLEVAPHPNADRLWVLKVDAGDRVRTIVAGIRQTHQPEDLTDRTIVLLSNLEPAAIRGVVSEGMLLAVRDGENIAILTTDRPVPPGCPVS